jgi:hypothetical protein
VYGYCTVGITLQGKGDVMMMVFGMVLRITVVRFDYALVLVCSKSSERSWVGLMSFNCFVSLKEGCV